MAKEVKKNIVKIAFFAGKAFVKGEEVEKIPKGFEKYFGEVSEVNEATGQEDAPVVETPTEDAGTVGVSMDNTKAEIEAFAQGEEIDLGDAKTKEEMLAVIEDARA